jgi:hypothetical protein
MVLKVSEGPLLVRDRRDAGLDTGRPFLLACTPILASVGVLYLHLSGHRQALVVESYNQASWTNYQVFVHVRFRAPSNEASLRTRQFLESALGWHTCSGVHSTDAANNDTDNGK